MTCLAVPIFLEVPARHAEGKEALLMSPTSADNTSPATPAHP